MDATRGPLLLRTTFGLSVAVIAATLVGTVVGVVTALASDNIAMTIPVAQFWPSLYPTVNLTVPPTASITGGGLTQADVTISGLALDVRLWLVGAYLLQGVTTVLVSIALATLCSRLLRRDPFRAAMTIAARTAAISVMIGGVGWQLCTGVAGALASQQALTITGWTIDDAQVRGDDLANLGWPLPSTQFSVDLWPVWVGLAILAVTAAFRYGDILQHENDRLVRDTKGLV